MITKVQQKNFKSHIQIKFQFYINLILNHSFRKDFKQTLNNSCS